MSALDQLNLRPQEKRILVVVGFLIFVVLNWMFVRPLFGQFGAAQNELAKARKTQETYQAEIAKTPTYQAAKQNLSKQGSEVLTEELQLQRLVDQHITAAGIDVSRRQAGMRAAPGRTNQFFEDQGFTIDFSTYSTNLVEFLVGLASGNNMVRVQEMNLRPDGTGTRLSGSLLFVASYQKKAPPRAAVGRATASGAQSTSAPTTNRPAPAPEQPKTVGLSRPKTNANATATPAGASSNLPKPSPAAPKETMK